MPKTRLEKRITRPQTQIPTGLSRLKLRFLVAKNDELLFEIPQHLELMAASLAAGQSFLQVLTAQAHSAHGKFASHLRRLKETKASVIFMEVAPEETLGDNDLLQLSAIISSGVA